MPLYPPTTNNHFPPLNLILYGPPGTGKTYHTINKSIKIANPAFNLISNKRSEIKAEYKRLIKVGQVEFVTFHQSMSYEDFIEGIKPVKPEKSTDIQYEIVNGIFKNICLEAGKTTELFVTLEGTNKPLTRELFEEFYYSFSESLSSHSADASSTILTTKEGLPFELFKNSARSIVVRAGEKKTNQSVALSELVEVLFSNKKPTYRSYEHIIINKILEDKNFQQSNVDNTKKSFVLIIDEINRGNVSQVFGELITLIEDDKRGGAKEEIEVVLPYSKTSFKVPPNVFIIGTMNTADRSVEALDTALRRRFVFEEMAPDPELLCPYNALKQSWLTHWDMSTIDFETKFIPNFEKEHNVSVSLNVHRALEMKYEHTTMEELNEIDGKLLFKNAIQKPDDFIDSVKLLSTINTRLHALLDKDHLIGHAWIMGAKHVEDLRLVFKNKILPLLQEYFYNDYAKIGLILGNPFFEEPAKTKSATFAKFKGGLEIADDYTDKIIYRFRDMSQLTIQDFKSIYE